MLFDQKYIIYYTRSSTSINLDLLGQLVEVLLLQVVLGDVPLEGVGQLGVLALGDLLQDADVLAHE